MKIFITGARGTIGKIISTQLSEHEIISFDLPDGDARDYSNLINKMRGSDLVIHLAWKTSIENFKSLNIDEENIKMVWNVYKAVQELKITKVIMASSVHADDYTSKESTLMNPYTLPWPDSPYGASKVFLESLGRYFSKYFNIDVVCIRFMGLNSDNKPLPRDPLGKEKWFSHRDCGNLIKAIIKTKEIPNHYAIVYGVSDNTGRFHDIINPFGWMPQDKS